MLAVALYPPKKRPKNEYSAKNIVGPFEDFDFGKFLGTWVLYLLGNEGSPFCLGAGLTSLNPFSRVFLK